MDKLKKYKFINKIASLPFVEEIWLYGSRARNDNTERSDIDLAILCPTAHEEDWLKIIEIIENADTLLKIDCVRFDTLKTGHKLRDNILQFKEVIYSKNNLNKILWHDKFTSLGRALERLSKVLQMPDIDNADYLQDAAIQRFEFVIELYWKVLKKFLSYEKIEASSPREVLKSAFAIKLIDDETIWLSMLNDRNSVSHVYDEEEAKRVFLNIKKYETVLQNSYQKLSQRLQNMQ